MKAKGAVEAKAIMRHCDQSEREKNKHSNKDIDKSLTSRNWSMRGLSYSAACKEYDARIAELDSKPGANKRKDRVTYMGVDIPAPADLPKNQLEPWFRRTWEIFQEQTGNAGLEGWVHVDEVHNYVHNGQIVTSREHMHIGAIPAVNGRLCGKEFSSRKQIVALNTAIQQMSKDEFNVLWMNGSQQKSTMTVEQLKKNSLDEFLKREEAVNAREARLDAREKRLDEREADLDRRAKHVDQAAEWVEKARSAAENVEMQADTIRRIQERTRDDITPDWIDDALPMAVRPFRSALKGSYLDYRSKRNAEAREQERQAKEARERAQAEREAAEEAARRAREAAEQVARKAHNDWCDAEDARMEKERRIAEAYNAKVDASRSKPVRTVRVVHEPPEQERQEQSDDFDFSL